MLTLLDPLEVTGATLFRDADAPTTVHVLSRRPRLALDADGRPALHLLAWRGDAAAPAGGGLLSLTTVLSPADEDLAAAREALGDERALLRPFPVRGARLTVAVARADGASLDAPATAVSLTADLHAGALLELSPDDVALLLAAGETGSRVLLVRYELDFLFRLSDLRLRLWCDLERSRELAPAMDEVAPGDTAALRALLVESKVAGIALEASDAVDPALHDRVLTAATGLLDGLLAAGLAPGSPDRQIDVRLVAGQVLEGVEVVESLLELPPDLGPHLTFVDTSHGFFDLLEVRVRCPVDFAQGPVDKVKVTLRHGDATQEFVFQALGDLGLFRARRADEEGAYTWEALVVYQGGHPPRRLGPVGSTDPLLVLDLDRLGVLVRPVRLGALTHPAVQRVAVSLRYPPADLAHTVLLDAANPEETWRAVLDATTHPDPAPTAPVQVQIAWLLEGGDRVEAPWRDHEGPLVVGDPPREPAGFVVTLLAAGPFDALAYVLVELRQAEGEAVDERMLRASGEIAEWTLPREGESYHLRLTAVEASGARRTAPGRPAPTAWSSSVTACASTCASCPACWPRAAG